MSGTIEVEPANQSPAVEDGLLADRERDHKPQGKKKKKKKERVKKSIGKVKSFLSSPLRKIGSPLACASSPSTSSSSYPYYYGDRPIGARYICCLAPSPEASETPNAVGRDGLDPSSYAYVKNLLETNDFYAPECNVHKYG